MNQKYLKGIIEDTGDGFVFKATPENIASFIWRYSAEFFYRLFKRLRKYNAYITAVSQNVEEILRSDTGERDFHTGTDIAAPEGIPILAAADGTVTIANGTDSWGGGYGYYIKINHGSGLETLYAHCSAICVIPGQAVRQGEVIGYVGSTGNSTGHHLHFEMMVDRQSTNAMDYFPP